MVEEVDTLYTQVDAFKRADGGVAADAVHLGGV